MQALTDRLLSMAGGRSGGSVKGRLLRLALRVLPRRRQLKVGDYAYLTVSASGASFSLRPYKGLTVLLQPGKTPLVTMTVPGSGLTHRYRLPGPRLSKISWQGLLDAFNAEKLDKLATETMDFKFPGIDPPQIVIVPGRVSQIARFEIEPVERIVVSRQAMKRIGQTATEDAVRRECVRAGIWSRHGVLNGDVFEDEFERVGPTIERCGANE